MSDEQSTPAATDPAFDAFLARLLERPLPQNPMQRVRILAKELAEGAAVGHWRMYLYTFRGELTGDQENTLIYLQKRWGENAPSLDLLMGNQYLQPYSPNSDTLVITRQAFDLLDEAEPASIFISYKRSESSAFALLVLARLKAEGLEPFLDLSLVPGEDWQKGLKERIQKFDHLVALLGKETLRSEVCIQELTWAIEADVNILPVWHNGFVYRSSEWTLPPAIDTLLASTHTIRVIEESALAYNNAIVQLLNRFGVTP
ncbi:MAG: toll/interleukin-1 receptor domain-containing protein [Anaerolineae bacterium]|nr:toll/interleukin-1 receptor domain-containing protein [Anaerolineae bacterium]